MQHKNLEGALRDALSEFSRKSAPIIANAESGNLRVALHPDVKIKIEANLTVVAEEEYAVPAIAK